MTNQEKIAFLKRYWKVSDLTFIARFNRPKDANGKFKGPYGFFDRITDYYTGKPIKYPAPIAGQNYERVPFLHQPVVNGLEDGFLYQIHLDLVEEKDQRGNPLALRVTTLDFIDQEDTKAHLESFKGKDVLDEILSQNQIATNRFYGCPKEKEINGLKHFFLTDVMSVEEGNLLTYQGLRKDVLVSVGDTKLELGKYVTFSLRTALLASDGTIRFSIDDKAGIKPVEKKPYEEVVNLRLIEGTESPRSNRIIAQLMREIGKGLYSSKQRMIFELLQNADDAPQKDGTVEFHVHVSGDYLLIMHTGVPFNRADVEAITSAAESTKRGDKKKTGFKGIGFKSVFTDSDEVVIQSGGFLFAFQRNYPLFKSFDEFYFIDKRYQDHPYLIEENKKRWSKHRDAFEGVSHIPWQILPIWQQRMPKDIKDSVFDEYNNNVKIAIKFGADKIPGYLTAISDLTKIPQFILFLRNTHVFSSRANNITVSKSGDNPIEIKQKKAGRTISRLVYFKRTVSDISISDEAFGEMGLDFVKAERQTEIGVEQFFQTSKGQEIESIPPKLAASDSTEVSFAIPEIDGVYQAENRYLLKQEFSSFFTYLPMEERRIQLPFLVNADFVPSSDREKIQGDNPWNIYLVGHIADQHVKLLSELANAFKINKRKYHGYLSLLLRNEIPDDNTAQEIIDKYNDVYLNALSSAEFIVDDSLKVLPKDKVILDKTGLTKIFESDLLYGLTKTDKRFPHSQLDIRFLDYEYLDIEELDNDGFLDCFDEEGLKLFASHVSKLNHAKFSELLEWINEVVPLCKANGVGLMDVPFVKFKSEVYSLNQMLEKDDAWLAGDSVSDIETVIKELGYSWIDLDLSKHNNIRQELLEHSNYVSQAAESCSRLAGHAKLGELKPSSKVALLSFLADSEFMKGVVGEKFYLEQLALFSNQKGSGGVLTELIVPSKEILESTLHDFAMDLTEYEALPNRFKGKLIAEDEVFERFFLTDSLYHSWSEQFNATNIDTHGQELLNWYSRIADPEQISLSEWDQIPWLFINDEHRFELSENVCCPDSFKALSQDVYQLIHRVIGGNKVLPHYSSLALVKNFGLVCSEEPILKDISNWLLLDLSETNTFLDWVKKDKEASFFKEYTILSVDEKFQVQPSGGCLQYYSDNSALISFLSSGPDSITELHVLPKELYCKGLDRIGLLEGGELIRNLIENGFAKQAFAPFVAACDDIELSRMYLDALDAIHLVSSASYSKGTAEHQLFGMLLKLASEDETLFNFLNDRVFIDDEPLNVKNVSDNVIFKFKGNDEVKDKSYQLKLSDILPAHSKESKALTNVIEAFVDLNANTLRSKVFKAVDKRKAEIRQEILTETNEFFTPQQTVFLLLWNKDGREETSLKERDFDGYWREKDPDKWESYSKEFLSLVFDLKFYDYSDAYFIRGFNLPQVILPEEYSCGLDCVPKWVLDWINEGQQEKRKSFLVRAGLNDESSEIVRLRKAIVNDDFEGFKVSCAKVDDEHLKWSTLEWLLFKQINCPSNYLKELYSHLSKATVPSAFVIPVYESSGTDLLKLVHFKEGAPYHWYDVSWGAYEDDIFNLIREQNGLITSSFLPENIDKVISPSLFELVVSEDLTELKNKSRPLTDCEPLVSSWDKNDQYPIFIYEGNRIPFTVKYGDFEIPSKEKDTEVDLKDGTYYICSSQLGTLLSSLGKILPETAYDSIYRHLNEEKDSKARQAGRAEALYGDDELDALNRLFEGEERKKALKDENLAALIAGLIFLDKEGYDIKNAEKKLKESHKFAQLNDVEKEGEFYKVMGRSAGRGILYLPVSSWDRLDEDDTYLFVRAGNLDDEKYLFKTKEEVLAKSDTRYQVYRVEAKSSLETTEAFFSNGFDKKNTMLILRMKENDLTENIFGRPFETEENATTEDVHPGDKTDY